MRHTIIAAGLSAALIWALAACSGSSSNHEADDTLPPDEAAKVLIDRNWLDLWPESKDEQLHVYRFTPSMGGGVYQDRTLFKGHFELFQFQIEGDVIEFYLPEDERRVRSKYRIRRVKGPEPFDLQLTLDPSPKGPSIYYGRTAERGAGVLDLVPGVDVGSGQEP